MKRVSWKYLAGLVDGEGCIDLATTKVGDQFYIQPRMRISMAETAKDLLVMCQQNFGGHLESRARKEKNPNWQDVVGWTISGYKQACPLLRNIVNHLILKKEQARFALWMETNLKGTRLQQDVLNAVREEFKLMKRDPHRLSETAQERILSLLGSYSRQD
jgi:hypothetical protein